MEAVKFQNIVNKYSLRPFIFVPKGTRTLLNTTKSDVVRFIKEIDGSYSSGVIIDIIVKDSIYTASKNLYQFRNDNYKTEQNINIAENLINNILNDLNIK